MTLCCWAGWPAAPAFATHPWQSASDFVSVCASWPQASAIGLDSIVEIDTPCGTRKDTQR